MLKHLLLTTAAAAALAAAPVLALADSTVPHDQIAQNQTTQPAAPTAPAVPPTPPAADNQPATPPTPPAAENQPATPPAAQNQPATPPAAGSGESSGTAAATPPPSNVVIPQQRASDMRAERLIGMRVYNSNGDEVGKVNDLLFDKDGKITGVVLSVGGIFGIGAKAVGLAWTEVDVSPQQNLVQISYTKQQLEAAPEFKAAEPAKTEAPAAPMTGGTSTQ